MKIKWYFENTVKNIVSELFIINGGNNLAVAGGIVAIGVSLVGCGVSAIIGFAVGGATAIVGGLIV